MVALVPVSQPLRCLTWMNPLRLALAMANAIIDSSEEEDEQARRSFVRFFFEDSFIGDNDGRYEC